MRKSRLGVSTEKEKNMYASYYQTQREPGSDQQNHYVQSKLSVHQPLHLSFYASLNQSINRSFPRQNVVQCFPWVSYAYNASCSHALMLHVWTTKTRNQMQQSHSSTLVVVNRHREKVWHQTTTFRPSVNPKSSRSFVHRVNFRGILDLFFGSSLSAGKSKRILLTLPASDPSFSSS